MCVKFEYMNNTVREYNEREPLKEQVNGLKSIQVNYRNTKDTEEVSTLISQMIELLKLKVLSPFDVKFDCNDAISGARLASQLKKIEKSNKKAYVVKETIEMNTNLVKELDKIAKTMKDK